MIGTLADLITYAADRGTTIANTAASTQGLVRASDYIEYTYLLGSSCTAESPNVESAVYEAAIIEVASPGFWSKTYTPAEQKVLTKVEGISWTVVGDAKQSGASMPRSTKIDAMLRQCIGGGLYALPAGPYLV